MQKRYYFNVYEWYCFISKQHSSGTGRWKRFCLYNLFVFFHYFHSQLNKKQTHTPNKLRRTLKLAFCFLCWQLKRDNTLDTLTIHLLSLPERASCMLQLASKKIYYILLRDWPRERHEMTFARLHAYFLSRSW